MMAVFSTPFADWASTLQLATFIGASVTFAFTLRVFYRLYFDPLAKFPGPRVAAVSDLWLVLRTWEGRWPWAVEEAIQKYGDIVRVAPNELVFSTPQAFADIYGSHTKNLESFAKTQINNHGSDKHGGIIWEWDPARHRQVAKQLAPAFSGRALRAKEATIHKYVDLFVQRLKEQDHQKGVSLNDWINWLSVDIAADTAYNRQMHALDKLEQPAYLALLQQFNKAVVVIQASWRFPFLSPLKYAYLILKTKQGHGDIRAHSRQLLEKRIRLDEAEVAHPDFFAQLIPASKEPPTDALEMRHLEQVAGQLLLAGYEPPSIWFYFTLFHLLESKEVLETLAKEVREQFATYEDITADSAAALPYLTACLRESLRMMPVIPNGMPVVSPGAVVDGTYIPKGTVCQTSFIALARNPKNFRFPAQFRPERWLDPAHPLYDAAFEGDNRDGLRPFSQGPRMCPGKEIAWWESRIFVAKTLWAFDLKLVEGQSWDMRRDLKAWGMWVKPEVMVKFVPRADA